MKTIKRIELMAIVLVMLLLLSACRSEAERHELSGNMDRSVSAFERRSGTKLKEQSNGVYEMNDVVQVIAPKKKVTTITLLDKEGKYTVFGVSIGMNRDKADTLLKGIFGKEISKTTDPVNKAAVCSYIKDKKQLYITYDLDKKTVTGLSYCMISEGDNNSSITEEPEKSGQMMLLVGDTKIYYNEAMAYLLAAMDNYETNYGKGIWNADILGKGETFGRMIKEEVIKQITELKIIKAEAALQKVSLTEEEQADADSYAMQQYDRISKEDRQRYLITEDLMKQVYRDNALADKMFENLTINVNTKVSDKQAKQITVQDIFIQNYNLDAEDNKVALSETDKIEAYQKVKSLLKQAKKTQDFKSLAEANSEGEKIEYTFGQNGAPKNYGDTFEKAAFALKTGQLSDIITTETGWHILYCVSDFNEDATIQVKENIIDERRSDMFRELYGKWAENYNVVVNDEAWDAVSLDK